MNLSVSNSKTLRTLIQVTAAVLVCLAGLVPVLGLNVGKYAAVGAGIIALAGIVTKVQTALEASGKVPAMLAPTPPEAAPAAPVDGQAGLVGNEVLWTLVAIAALIALVIWILQATGH